METPPTVATLRSTATRYIGVCVCQPLEFCSNNGVNGRDACDHKYTRIQDGVDCENTVLFSKEAGPSIKRTKTSDDSGLDMDNAAENGGGDSVIEGGASEIELVFRPHPTLMDKDDGHNR